MTRALTLLPAWWFFQMPSAAPPSNPWPEYGLGGAMVALIVYLWTQDRKSRVDYQTEADKRYALQQAESEKRYSVTIQQLFEQQREMKTIISGNTTAMTTLADKLAGKISNCPMASDPVMGAWMRTWLEHSTDEIQKRRRAAEVESE